LSLLNEWALGRVRDGDDGGFRFACFRQQANDLCASTGARNDNDDRILGQSIPVQKLGSILRMYGKSPAVEQ
jgi:hypothetical protein